jgi:hypothetical protein
MQNNDKKNYFGFGGGFGGEGSFCYPMPSHEHVIYIHDLDYMEDHFNKLQQIRQANPDDMVRVIINTYGGRVDIAMAYVSAMRESQATVVTHAEGQVCSAGTILWLASKERTVAPMTEFMFHNYQGGAFGDGANIYTQVLFYKQHFDRLIDYFYKGVLTDGEINTIKGGGQVWLDEVEITKRTRAVILDDKNIERMKSGKNPIVTPVGVKDTQKDDTVTGDPDRSVVLKVHVDGETFSLDVRNLKASDFDIFNIDELQSILSQVGAIAQGEEKALEITSRDRQALIEALLTAGEVIIDTFGNAE